MAGAGSRFVEKGYVLPKPLLPIGQKPMVVAATLMLPLADKHIFIIRKEHALEAKIDDSLLEYFPSSTIIELDYLTQGQASTCLLSKPVLDLNQELIIAACDNGMLYDIEKFEDLKTCSDAIVFTFRNNQSVLAKPEAYGWIKVSGDKVVNASVKKPVSNNPMSDHAIVGAFWFKKASYFTDAAEKMIAENRRINGEFYVDECINDLLAMNLNVRVFEIKRYLCWGTPEDYENYINHESSI